MSIILYGKLGRSMPLTLEKCGTLGGDIEMTATLTALAKMRPNDEIWLIGRNSGEYPSDVGLPDNVYNPWAQLSWKEELAEKVKALGLPKMNYSAEEQFLYASVIDDVTKYAWQHAEHIVMWVGQHGTTNTPIPKVKDRAVLTKPQDAFMYYCGYLLRGINRWRDVAPAYREPIFLNADPRNYLKMRDLKHPLTHPVLTQYEFTHNIKHERYGDTKQLDLRDLGDVWPAKVHNVYSRLELNALLPGTPSGDLLKFDDRWIPRAPFGVVINEARVIGIPYEKSRLHAMHNWIMPLHPYFVFGTWSKESEASLMTEFPWYTPGGALPWSGYADTMHQVRCTFTTPSSGSGWATTKPWEAFGLGVVCFFHPDYDTQNNILRDAPDDLKRWLRVKTPAELRDRVIHLSTPAGRADWEGLVHQQRVFFDMNVTHGTPLFLSMINDRLERHA